MLVSYQWLQEEYFDEKLPKPKDLVSMLTMHAFEVEEMHEVDGDTIIDIDVLPNRAHDCLSHRGIAREISVLAKLRLKNRMEKSIAREPSDLSVEVSDSHACRRYVGTVVKNISVGPSPDWLRKRLEAIGQRSINNIVDVANYVMWDTGQPLHAFDADKLDGGVVVRMAREGEMITTLDNREISLDLGTLIIADRNDPLAIAGIKGGKKAEVEEHTKNLVLEAANFHPVITRKTARRVNVQTDSSKRFENEISTELACSAMKELIALIVDIAGTNKTVVGESVDVYPRKPLAYRVGISPKDPENILGVQVPKDMIFDIFERLNFSVCEVTDPLVEVIAKAREYIGAPYKYGASITYDAPRFFDCSSFVSYCYAQAGIQIPRMAVDQYVFGEDIYFEKLTSGDIIFSNTGEGKSFDTSQEFFPGTKIEKALDHCGIYLGNGEVIHASRHNSDGVMIEKLETSYQFRNIVGYRRMFQGRNSRIVVTVPYERLDIRIKEDLVEEIGRVYGYEHIDGAVPKQETDTVPPIPAVFYHANRARRMLEQEGFSETYNYSFRDTGNIELENPMASGREYMRTNLTDGLMETLRFNERYADLLGLDQIKMFEIGTVFGNNGESTHIAIGIKNKKGYKKEKEKNTLARVSGILEKLFGELRGTEKILPDGGIVLEVDLGGLATQAPNKKLYEDVLTIPTTDNKFRHFSVYPFILRDIAVWVSDDISRDKVKKLIADTAGHLLVRITFFDEFTRDGKTSYAFRLVFQSPEKTLMDSEVGVIMDRVVRSMVDRGWKVR